MFKNSVLCPLGVHSSFAALRVPWSATAKATLIVERQAHEFRDWCRRVMYVYTTRFHLVLCGNVLDRRVVFMTNHAIADELFRNEYQDLSLIHI